MTDSNEKYILQSISNTLDILDFLAQHKELSVPEIAEGTSFGKSSVFRILATLEAKNYVKKSLDAPYSLNVNWPQDYLNPAANETVDFNTQIPLPALPSPPDYYKSLRFSEVRCDFQRLPPFPDQ